MSNGQTIRLISAVAQLLGVLVWPAVVLFFIVWFRRGLADFLSNLAEFSFKVPGVEATAKRQEAAVALGAAVAARAPGDGTPGPAAEPREIAEALPSARDQRRLQGSRVLWVDDRPGNNVLERQTLEALGIQIDLSTSTEDALEKIRRRSYDLIGPYPLRWTPGLAARFVGSVRNGFDTPLIYAGVQGAVGSFRP